MVPVASSINACKWVGIVGAQCIQKASPINAAILGSWEASSLDGSPADVEETGREEGRCRGGKAC